MNVYTARRLEQRQDMTKQAGILHRGCGTERDEPLDCLRGGRDRGDQAFDQRFFVERLAQKTDRSVFQRTGPVFLVRISSNQNDRRLISPRLQCFLQFKAA